MKGDIKNFTRTYLVPLLFTVAAFIFWKTYSPGKNYWWLIVIAIILLSHYYYYFKKLKKKTLK